MQNLAAVWFPPTRATRLLWLLQRRSINCLILATSIACISVEDSIGLGLLELVLHDFPKTELTERYRDGGVVWERRSRKQRVIYYEDFLFFIKNNNFNINNIIILVFNFWGPFSTRIWCLVVKVLFLNALLN